jgi:hypothetical protein
MLARYAAAAAMRDVTASRNNLPLCRSSTVKDNCDDVA